MSKFAIIELFSSTRVGESKSKMQRRIRVTRISQGRFREFTETFKESDGVLGAFQEVSRRSQEASGVLQKGSGESRGTQVVSISTAF